MYYKSFRLFMVLFLMAQMAFGQRGQVVIETSRSMSFGTRPSFRLEFDAANADLVEDAWKDFAKQRFSAKLKKDKKSGEWTAAKLKNAALGSDPFTMYSTIEKTSSGAALNVWFDLGTYFLNRKDNAGATEEITRALRDCYYDVRRAVINKTIKEQEDLLKDMEKKQKNLTKDNESFRKDIENYKAKIKKAEEDIVKNEQILESNIVDMDAQRRLLEESRRRLENVANEGN